MKDKIKIILVAGARPNFMKIGPLMHELNRQPRYKPLLVHTGQHYDKKMSELFFKQLDIPEPHINLDVGSDSHARQTARIMERFESVCLDENPDAVLVVGDVNSTVACVLVAAKLSVTTIHYEAGLRSRDRSMPEEINRLMTDSVCDLYFTISEDASRNLLDEGILQDKIFMCGNLMIDSLIRNQQRIAAVDRRFKTVQGLWVQPGENFPPRYGVLTFHRPANVDSRPALTSLVKEWISISERIPLIFPVHPRTLNKLREFELEKFCDSAPGLLLTEAMGYHLFLRLVQESVMVITDSGGIQEETTFLNIPCLTVRPSTERPVTISIGSNTLVNVKNLSSEVDRILQGKAKQGTVPKFWDGRSSERILAVLNEKLV